MRAKVVVRVILLTVLATSLAVLGWVLWMQRPLTPHHVISGGNTINVLFIGNSYTYVNNMPGLLKELSAHEAKPVDVEMIAEGGATLANHWNDGKALAAIQRGGWDFVVLQEQSTLGASDDNIGDPKWFQYHVRQFNTEIQKAGAKPLLYLTWARQNAPQSQAALNKAYYDIANELHIGVAPVGIAWQQVLKQIPPLPLYQDDGSHPDQAGSYLAACTFYAEIYGKTPEGLPAQVSSSLVDDDGILEQGNVNLSAADALTLQRIVWQVMTTPG